MRSEAPLRLRPAGLLEGAAAAIEQGRALPLAGGPLALAEVEALARKPDGCVASGAVGDLLRWSAERATHMTARCWRGSRCCMRQAAPSRSARRANPSSPG